MAKRVINIGDVANDKKGDSLRAAFTKVNENFTELYTELGLTNDLDLNLGAFEFNGSTMTTTDSSAIVIDQAATVTSNLTVGGDLLPSTANGGTLGSSTKPWRELYVSNSTVYFNNIPIAIDELNNLTVNGVPVNSVGSADWSAITNKPTFSNAATSGAWVDITGKPSILSGDDIIGFVDSNTITEETPGGTVSQTTSYQNQIIVDTTDAIRIANIITQTVDDSVVTTTDSTGSTIDVDGTGVYIKKYAEPDGPNNSSYFQISTSNSGAVIEGVNEELVGDTYGRVTVTQGVVAINVAAEGVDKQWSFNSGGEVIVPEASTILGTNDLTIKSQVAGNSSGLFLNGNTLLGTAVLYAHNNAIIRADYDGNVKDWNFDKSGTLTTPSLLPRSFTATVDNIHYAGEGSLTLEGDSWYFAVEFSINANGSVETIITNNTPWGSNPGYANNMPFEFTEIDHGIPGYTFTLTLVDIQNPGPMMYTTNLTASIAPTLPSTIASPETIKLTADAASWKFSPNGNLYFPDGTFQGTAAVGADTGDVTFAFNKIMGTNNSLILKADPDDGYNNLWGIELYNSYDNDTHLRALDRKKGIAFGFGYGTNGSSIRVEGSEGQNGIPNSGDKVAIVAARNQIDYVYSNTIDFSNEVMLIDGITLINGVSQRNETELEVNLFVPSPSALNTKLSSLALNDTVIITYRTTSVNYSEGTISGPLSQLVNQTGQTDPNNLTFSRMAFRIQGTLPVDYNYIVKVNFPNFSFNQSAEWTFDNDGKLALPGALEFPNGTVVTGGAVAVETGYDYEISTQNYQLASAEAMGGTAGQMMLVDTTFVDDITIVQAGWQINAGTLEAPIWLTVAMVIPGNGMFSIDVPGFDFQVGTTYTFRNPAPIVYGWMFTRNGELQTPGLGYITHQNNDLKLEVSGTDVIVLRTAGGDLVVPASGGLQFNDGTTQTTAYLQAQYDYLIDGTNTPWAVSTINMSLINVTPAAGYAGSDTHTINLPAGTSAQRLVIVNASSLCSVSVDGMFTIAPSTAAEFIYAGGTWGAGWLPLYGTV